MKIFNLEQKTPEWDLMRRGKITGTKLKGLMSKTRQDWIYDLVAERLSMYNIKETALEHGNRLEVEAVEYFENKTNKKVARIGFTVSDKSEWIASSPDGLILDEVSGKFTEALEVKCLAGKNHVKAFFEREIPDEYMPQVLQYFIVNTDLKKLYFMFYDDQIKEIPCTLLEVTREELAGMIEAAEKVQRMALAEVEALLNKILFQDGN